MEHTPDILSFFSSVSLHGLASSSTDTDSVSASEPLILHRTKSFPARRYSWCRVECTTETDADWDARAVPVGKPHADFELLEKLSEGRISIVFAARLVYLRQCPGGDVLPDSCLPGSLPDQFCVKLAKAELIRSLARDAWFYEQLAKEDGLQGVITPLCFGFFTVSLPSTFQIHAWSEIECVPEKHDREPVYDRFRDDESSSGFTDDQRTFRNDCPWSLERWMSRTDRAPIIGVLIMEKLGDHFSSGPNRNQLLRDSESEIMDILDDLSSAGIMHGDIKFNNLLRPTSSIFSSACPRHNRTHPWRIIDFDRATKWGKFIPRDVEHFTMVQRVQFEDGFFWGGGWE